MNETMKEATTKELADAIESAVRFAIARVLDNAAPNWRHIGIAERQAIAERLRKIATETNRRKFLQDKVPRQ